MVAFGLFGSLYRSYLSYKKTKRNKKQAFHLLVGAWSTPCQKKHIQIRNIERGIANQPLWQHLGWPSSHQLAGCQEPLERHIPCPAPVICVSRAVTTSQARVSYTNYLFVKGRYSGTNPARFSSCPAMSHLSPDLRPTSFYLDRYTVAGIEVFAFDVRVPIRPGVPKCRQEVTAAVQLGHLPYGKRHPARGMGEELTWLSISAT